MSQVVHKANAYTRFSIMKQIGGLLVSALESGASSLDLTLAGDIVLCSWAKHFTFTVSLSTQVYKWVWGI